MVTGRSKEVFKPPLATQPDIWRRRTEIVAMNGFTGFKSATAEEFPGARTVTGLSHPAPTTPASRPVHYRGARRTRGHMAHLPEHRRRLPHARHELGQGPDACRNQHKDLHARTQLPDRTHDAGQDAQTPSRGHPVLLRSSHTSNGPTEAINGRLEHLRGSALRFAKPHQLHRPNAPRNRPIQTPTTPPIRKAAFVHICPNSGIYNNLRLEPQSHLCAS
mgnify:CR=1 FL=1